MRVVGAGAVDVTLGLPAPGDTLPDPALRRPREAPLAQGTVRRARHVSAQQPRLRELRPPAVAAAPRLFGTDGIRGRSGEHPVTPQVARQLGRALARAARAQGAGPHKLLIGRDTRASGEALAAAFASGIRAEGVDVVLIEPLPTHAVALLGRALGAQGAVMITASHNPAGDNGFKFFGADGFKLSRAAEETLEAQLASGQLRRGPIGAHERGRIIRLPDALARYTEHVIGAGERRLDGLRIAVDCAHGAGAAALPHILRALGATLTATLGTTPDGGNINDRSGALHPERLRAEVLRTGAAIGLALDGDADRLIVVDERGEVLDGDAIMAILARDLIAKDRLAERTLVATVMSSAGLDRALSEVGGRVVRTDVGDHHVVERMRQQGLSFGGEQCGHLIAQPHATTGDACIAARLLLDVLVQSGAPLSTLASVFQAMPQRLVSVPVARKPLLDSLPEVTARVREAERALADRGRVLLRYSGTEDVARVMVEGPDPAETERLAEHIAEALRRALGPAR